MIKKNLLLLLVCTLLFTGAYASSAKTVKIEASDIKSATAGETVTVNISVKDNPGMAVLAFDVEYNTEHLTLKNVTHFDDVFAKNNFTAGKTDKQPYKVLALYSSGNRSTNGTLLALSFYIKDTAPSGTYDINLTNFECYNIDEQEVSVISKNGSIKVTSENNTEKPQKGENAETQKPSSGGSSYVKPNIKGDNENIEDKENKDNNEKPYNVKKSIILTIGKKDASVFGTSKANDVAPILKNSRTMLPARFVAENLGADVLWFEAEEKVVIKKNKIEIIIYINSTKAYVNGKEEILDSPAFLENGRTYTPLRFVAEKLGAKVYWEDETQNVIIEKIEQ